MATDSGIFAWRIPWTEEPGRLQSVGSQRVGHDLATKEQQQQRKPDQWGWVKQPLCAQQCQAAGQMLRCTDLVSVLEPSERGRWTNALCPCPH